jgi:hypothetical protein
LKSKLLFSILAVASAIVAPVSAISQVAPERPPKDLTGPDYKYEVYVGYGYTSLNQVNQSRSGLQGVSGSVTRRFGDHFGLKVDGGHYAWSVTATNAGNPRWSIRAFGDDIGSSFTLVPYQPGYSPHTRWNARAGIGLAYHF